MEMLKDLIWTDESDTVVTPLSSSPHIENATDCGGGGGSRFGPDISEAIPWWDRSGCN